MKYKHTQFATVIVVVSLAIAVPLCIFGFSFARPALIGAIIVLLCACLFYSLTVEVDETEVRWSFGIGLIRKRARLDEIAKAEQVRTNFLEGWGIHLSRYGWLYNVSGWDAIAFTMKNGKCFAIGTDEPQALLASVNGIRGESKRA